MTNRYNDDVIYVPDCMARTEELMFPLKNASPELTTLRNIAVAEGLIDRTLISMAALLTRQGADPAALINTYSTPATPNTGRARDGSITRPSTK